MWPGTISLRARENTHGTSIFGLLAMAGDIGCVMGPALVGFISNGAAEGLQTGMLAATVFPILMLIALTMLRRKSKA